MKTIRAGVIGTGFIGPAHVEALGRIGGVRVVAISSRSHDRARALAEKAGAHLVYADWKKLVADPAVEVVHNCTPNNLHFEINKAAILAGKHVVSEKPLTMTAGESAELLRLAEKSGIVHAVNYNYRFYPLIQHARAMVQGRELGEVYLVHGHYLQDWLYYDTDYNWRLEWKLSGKSRAVADIGTHWCDLVQFITGLRITSVFADLVTVHRKRRKPRTVVETFKGKESKASRSTGVRIDTEDAGIVMVRFENGTRGVFTVSQVSAGRKNREWFEIDGSKKALAWNQEEPNSLWVGYRDRPNEIVIKDPALLHESVRKYAHYPGGHPEGYPEGPMNLFMNVYQFIRERKDPRKSKPDFPTFHDGHWENRVIAAVLKSNKKRTWINV
ncbi:MAG: Gfo/Idh/MocA family oxidoreductase [Ignavibacteriales bacterium]|nr:Gfo/Idh/MocA family oxidoreductase [Ignavibacteriales bacterium]